MKFNTPPFGNSISTDRGILHSSWQSFISILTNNFNQYLSDLGYIFPSINNSTATGIANNYKQSIVYNSDNQRMELNNSGTYQAIATVSSGTTSDIGQLAIQPQNIGRIFVNTDNNSLQFSLDGLTIRTIGSV